MKRLCDTEAQETDLLSDRVLALIKNGDRDDHRQLSLSPFSVTPFPHSLQTHGYDPDLQRTRHQCREDRGKGGWEHEMIRKEM